MVGGQWWKDEGFKMISTIFCRRRRLFPVHHFGVTIVGVLCNLCSNLSYCSLRCSAGPLLQSLMAHWHTLCSDPLLPNFPQDSLFPLFLIHTSPPLALLTTSTNSFPPNFSSLSTVSFESLCKLVDFSFPSSSACLFWPHMLDLGSRNFLTSSSSSSCLVWTMRTSLPASLLLSLVRSKGRRDSCSTT